MLFANNCNTTLNGGITAVATSMVVTSATGFPVPTGSQYFYCTLADAATQTTIEIVKVTAVSGTTFTIVRGQDGTSGTIFASGAVVSLRLVRASLNDFPKLDEANTFTQAQTFSALTSGRIPYSSTGGLQTDSANLVFDGTNLGIGGTPALPLDVQYASSQTRIYSTTATNPAYTQYRVGSNISYIGSDASSGAYFAAPYATIIWNSGAYSVVFGTNALERMRIFSSGGVSIGNTTDPGAGNLRFNSTSNGIYFGSSALLNDYQTGTYTVTRSGFVEVIGVGSITNVGKYTKIGNLVKVTITITCAGGATISAGSGAVASLNLPFTPSLGTSGTWCNSSSLTTAGSSYAQTNANLYIVTGWTAASSSWTIEVSYIV